MNRDARTTPPPARAGHPSLLALLCGALLMAGGAAAQDRPAPQRVHMISGAREYRSAASLEILARHLRTELGLTCTQSAGRDRCRGLPGLEKLAQADVLVVFCRRLELPEEQLAPIRAWCREGRPLVGIRTASHAFQTWLGFDRQVLGGDYSGHGPAAEVTVAAVEAHGTHPVLRGIAGWRRRGKLYRNPDPAADIEVLLTGTAAGETHPVAWARTLGNGGRVFYTSLGVPEDFTTPAFLELLTNAVLWTTGRTP